MTLPVEPTPQPPATIGTQPKTADEVNALTGSHLRGFMASKTTVHQDADFLTATDLKVAPYFFTADQETEIKTAVLQLNTSLEAIDMTFISRIVGMF